MGFESDKHFLSVHGVLVVSDEQFRLTSSCTLVMDSDSRGEAGGAAGLVPPVPGPTPVPEAGREGMES